MLGLNYWTNVLEDIQGVFVYLDHSQLLTNDCLWISVDDASMAVCPDGSVSTSIELTKE